MGFKMKGFSGFRKSSPKKNISSATSTDAGGGASFNPNTGSYEPGNLGSEFYGIPRESNIRLNAPEEGDDTGMQYTTDIDNTDLYQFDNEMFKYMKDTDTTRGGSTINLTEDFVDNVRARGYSSEDLEINPDNLDKYYDLFDNIKKGMKGDTTLKVNPMEYTEPTFDTKTGKWRGKFTTGGDALQFSDNSNRNIQVQNKYGMDFSDPEFERFLQETSQRYIAGKNKKYDRGEVLPVNLPEIELTDNKITADNKVEMKDLAIGSEQRKAEYDRRNWKYDDTIKNFNRDGSRKQEKKVKLKKKPVKKMKSAKGGPSLGNWDQGIQDWFSNLNKGQ